MSTRVLANKLTEESSELYVVTCISNPCRYKSRYDLYRSFKDYVDKSDAQLVTAELAQRHRPFEITDKETLENIQVRGDSDFWAKENLLNIACQFLPNDWEYVAFVDADVRFVREDWVNETLQLLQHYDVVQMFGQAHDLGPNKEIMKTHKGFIKAYYENDMRAECSDGYGYTKYFGHPGFAWAYKRQALDNVGGLIDIGILGASDNHMAHALVGEVRRSIPASLADTGYGRELVEWEERAKKYVNFNVGYMEGSLIHAWHGKKANRRYKDRWNILVDNQFDPDTDLYRDSQGLYRLTDNKPKLKFDIRKYFKDRQEDSIDL